MFPSAAQLVYYIAGLLGISITRGEKDDGTIAYMQYLRIPGRRRRPARAAVGYVIYI